MRVRLHVIIPIHSLFIHVKRCGRISERWTQMWVAVYRGAIIPHSF